MGSSPTMESSNPKTPTIKPFTMDLPDTETIMLRPKIAKAKYSAGPKRSANRAMGKAKIASSRVLKRPPKTE